VTLWFVVFNQPIVDNISFGDDEGGVVVDGDRGNLKTQGNEAPEAGRRMIPEIPVSRFPGRVSLFPDPHGNTEIEILDQMGNGGRGRSAAQHDDFGKRCLTDSLKRAMQLGKVHDPFLDERVVIPHHGVSALVGTRIESQQILHRIPEFRQSPTIMTSPLTGYLSSSRQKIVRVPRKTASPQRHRDTEKTLFTFLCLGVAAMKSPLISRKQLGRIAHDALRARDEHPFPTLCLCDWYVEIVM